MRQSMRQTRRAALLAAVAVGLAISVGEAQGATIISLSPANAGGAGQHGLYLAGTWLHQESSITNWEWVDVSLAIDDDGSARVAGTMQRFYDRENDVPGLWGIDVQLRDVRLVGGSSVSQILDRGTAGTGLEWGSLSMTLTRPPTATYRSNVPETGWAGLAGPDGGDGKVAELQFDPNGIAFEAWYGNTNRRDWYQLGDSKATGELQPPILEAGGGTGNQRPPMPEPGGAVLFCVGLLVVARQLRQL
jgi:hypothetical protein